MLHRDDVSNCVRLPMPCVSNLMCMRQQARAYKNTTINTPYVTYIYKLMYLCISLKTCMCNVSTGLGMTKGLANEHVLSVKQSPSDHPLTMTL